MKRPYKRKRVFVHNLQKHLLVVNLIYFFTLLLIFVTVLFVPIIIEMESASLSPEKAQEAANQFLILHTRAWPAIATIFILMIAHSFIVSHRIAGPLFRLRSILKMIQEGDLSTQVTIRRHDYLLEEVNIMNEMIVALRNRIVSIQEHYWEAHAALAESKRAFHGGSVEEMGRHLNSLEVKINQLKMDVDQFRTAPAETRAEEN